MAENKGVLILGEVAEGKLTAINLELLGCGRKLAGDLGEELSVALLGSGVGGLAGEAIAFGADRVYVVDNALLTEYQPEAYIATVEKIIKQITPRVLLLGQSAVGRDLAPRLAFRLGAGLSMDCVELAIDPKTRSLTQTRPVYGGNARAIFTTVGYPQIATIRAKAFSPLERDASRKGEVTSLPVTIDPSQLKTRVMGKVKEEVKGIKLEEAQAIVCGGRGIGGPEGFKQLEALARALKGAVGATRPPCDNGWVPTTWQIGLTGKIVTPTLYIAVALSGSSQHMAGCSGAKNIIAINKDPEANIFKEARFGVVGDWKQLIPALTEKCKELMG